MSFLGGSLPPERAPAYNAAMIIRAEEPTDRAAVYDVVHAAFGRANEAALVDQLRADGASVISLVAVVDVSVIGHVMLSTMRAPFPALGLAPLSVRPDRQRSGVGSSLVRQALARARQERFEAVFVLGDPAFYGRFGFRSEPASGFSSPYAGPHFMVVALKRGLPARTGTIDHPSAFAALE